MSYRLPTCVDVVVGIEYKPDGCVRIGFDRCLNGTKNCFLTLWVLVFILGLGRAERWKRLRKSFP